MKTRPNQPFLQRVIPFTLALPFGCSLITPLDFVGNGQQGGSGGQMAANSGGSGADGGFIGAGGTVMSTGGTSEATGGTDGEGGTAGAGAGAGAGAPSGGAVSEGGSAGTAGMGGAAGAAGAGGCAGAECCDVTQTFCAEECVDLMTDAAHCGDCDNACDDDVSCEGGRCLDSPCVGLCDNPMPVSEGSDGFRVDNVGSAARCFEVVNYHRPAMPPSIICWGFADARTLSVNGTLAECMAEPGFSLPRERGKGYCVQMSEGPNDWTGFKLPIP
jgi:hypothetical protein